MFLVLALHEFSGADDCISFVAVIPLEILQGIFENFGRFL